MSATMARQGGRVQLEQSDVCLGLNKAKMAKEGFSHAAIEETKYLIRKPHAEVREEKKWGVEFPAHKQVKAAIQRHPALLLQNQTAGCLACQNRTAENPQTRSRRKGTGATPPDRRRERAPKPTPPLPGTPPPQPVTLREFNLLKSLIWLPDIRIWIQLFPTRNLSMSRKPSTTPILVQICWLTKVSTLSVVW